MGEKTKSSKKVITVCAGNSCSDNQSKRLRSRLKDYVEEKGLKDAIKVKKGDCVKRCKDGPIVTVTPGDLQLERVKPRDAERVIKKVLAL